MTPIIADAQIDVPLFSRASLVDEPVTVGGVAIAPDAGTAALVCTLSHTVPVFTFYGEAIAPRSVAAGWNSILHKPVNRDHQMRSHDPESIARDRVIGCVVAAEPDRGLRTESLGRVPRTVEESPGITAGCAIFKGAEGVPKILGEHLAARKEYTVSMELHYLLGQSGFLVDCNEVNDNAQQIGMLASEIGADDTPPEWRAAGWLYVPVQRADESLLDARCILVRDGKLQVKQNHMRDRRPDGNGWFGKWRDHTVWWMMGGLGGDVSYKGVGVVGAGAEPTAQITQMRASRPDDREELALAGRFMTALTDSLKKISQNPA